MNNLNDQFEEFVKNLQKEIDDEESKTFSKRVIELSHNPKNWGKMENPTVEDKFLGPCGDTMQFFLKINEKNNIIEKITFITDGCGPSVASGSQLTIMAENKSIEETLKITPEDILKELEGLPSSHTHCPILTVNTLDKVLKKYFESKK